jgi:histidinol dehydrogenase
MTTLRFAFRGALSALDGPARVALFDRATTSDAALRATVAEIIAEVLCDGDDALRRCAARFDGATLDSLEVPRARWTDALDGLDSELRRAMERAAVNIRDVHDAFRPEAVERMTGEGVVIGRRPDPLARVGVYAPGGRAAYPSSVLMGAVPARVAGVGEVILCSPPGADGSLSIAVLAAAALAGVDRVFAIGGVGAIAAMAYGTASVPAVDRIVGPGNAFVAEAKVQVSGTVAIDSPAGPSELLVIADDSASPVVIAREMLAQAEHDPVAAVVLVTDSAVLESAVFGARLVDSEPRAAIIRAAFRARGALVRVPSLDDAIAFSNRWAPEHLLLDVRADLEAGMFGRLRNAGSIFLGASASVAFGDYLSGANHVLPTGGAARSYSGLSTLDFVRWTTYQRMSPVVAARFASDVGTFADAEGLPAHAAAARQWSGAC